MLKTFVRNAVSRLLARPLLVMSNMTEDARRARLLHELKASDHNVVIRPNVTITRPERINVGNNVLLNHGTMLFAGGGITLGSNIVIGPGCMLLTGNHRGEIFYGSIESQPILIGNNVWLGARVIVTPGVVIGTNVIVSAGAVVTSDIPDMTICGGIPARKIKDLELPFDPMSRERPKKP